MPDLDDDNDNDLQLFRDLVGEVTPVHSDKLPPKTKAIAPRARSREADDQAVMQELLEPDEYSFGFDDDVETGEELSYSGDGIDNSSWRKLRRGEFRTDGILDLHGMKLEAAHEAVKRFIQTQRDANHRCLRIIHGKGKGEEIPVMKRGVDGWLRRNKWVIAYCSCRPQDGGTGAVYVLIRRARNV